MAFLWLGTEGGLWSEPTMHGSKMPMQALCLAPKLCLQVPCLLIPFSFLDPPKALPG